LGVLQKPYLISISAFTNKSYPLHKDGGIEHEKSLDIY